MTCILLPYIAGFPSSSDSKESACNVGDCGLGRFPGEGNGYPLQYSCLENSMDISLAGSSPWSRRVRHNWVTNTMHCMFFIVLKHEHKCVMHIKYKQVVMSSSILIYFKSWTTLGICSTLGGARVASCNDQMIRARSLPSNPMSPLN